MKLIILDRDGVINQDSDAYIKSPAEWIPIDSSIEAIGRLSQAGWKVVIATNQSGIARGLFDMATLGEIHQLMQQTVIQAGGKIDAIFFCPHGPDDNCSCRKPAAGMLHDIATRFEVKLTGVPLVGDSLRDLQAAAKVGCDPYLVLTGKGQNTIATKANLLPPNTKVAANLFEVVDQLLKT